MAAPASKRSKPTAAAAPIPPPERASKEDRSRQTFLRSIVRPIESFEQMKALPRIPGKEAEHDAPALFHRVIGGEFVSFAIYTDHAEAADECAGDFNYHVYTLMRRTKYRPNEPGLARFIMAHTWIDEEDSDKVYYVFVFEYIGGPVPRSYDWGANVEELRPAVQSAVLEARVLKMKTNLSPANFALGADGKPMVVTQPWFLRMASSDTETWEQQVERELQALVKLNGREC